MIVKFIGHATIIFYDNQNNPIFCSDPWLIGSCYWRSWWLESPPDKNVLEQLSTCPFIYITHEHPDHFHFPTIKKIGKSPTYLLAKQAHKSNYNFLKAHGFQVNEIPSYKWVNIGNNLKIATFPQWNDDSVILIETPKYYFVNINDARLSKAGILKIKELLIESKKIILCQSYSPASFIHNFYFNNIRIEIVDKQSYIKPILKNCELLNADYFIPFASQNVFLRQDSSWANTFKIGEDDLRKSWSGITALLPNYPHINLDKEFDYTTPDRKFPPKEAYELARLEQNKSTLLDSKDLQDLCALLTKKFSFMSWLLVALFPMGIAFCLNKEQKILYSPIKRKAYTLKNNEKSSIIISTDSSALMSALKYDHFNDLSISMFTRIDVNHKYLHPRFLYLVFILLELHDHGHFKSVKNFFKFIKINIFRLLSSV